MGSTILIFLAVAAMLLPAGVGLVLAGGVVFWRHKKRTAGWATTGGVVVDVVLEAITPGNVHAYPLVEFVTEGGSTLRFKSKVGHYPARHRRGQRLAVKYNPANPEQVVIDSMEQWFVPAALAGLGVIALILAGMIVMIVSGG